MFLRSFSMIVPTLTLLGAHPARLSSVVPSAPERLVAEGEIRMVSDQPQVYLPVTLHGHTGTVVLCFIQLGGGLSLSGPKLTKLGVAPPAAGTLDSMTFGTTLLHNVAVQMGQWPLTALDQPGLPPVIGLVGWEFLAHYDVVVDGPAHRVRLYTLAPLSPAPGNAGTTTLPPGVHAADCTPTLPTPEGDPGFAIQADGHPVIAVLQTGHPYTVMNTVAARLLGLTQHSPNVQAIPDSLQTRYYQNVPDKYLVTGIHLTLGRYPFTEIPIHILARAPLEPTPTTPTIELKVDNLLAQIFVLSNSTGQVCLGEPR